MGQARATLGTSKRDEQGTTKSGAGVGGPEAAVGETQRPTPTPPRRGATAFQPPSWDFSRTSPSARIEESRAVVEARTPTPNAAAPRLLGQRPCRDEYGVFHRTKPQKARRGGAGVFFSVVGERERPTPTRKGQPNRLATRLPRAACLRTSQPLLQPQPIEKGAWRGGRRRKGALHPILQPSSCVRSPPTPW